MSKPTDMSLMSMVDHLPIHSPRGVEYWDGNMQEYILDPTPDINLRPDPEFRTQEFKRLAVTEKVYGEDHLTTSERKRLQIRKNAP